MVSASQDAFWDFALTSTPLLTAWRAEFWTWEPERMVMTPNGVPSAMGVDWGRAEAVMAAAEARRAVVNCILMVVMVVVDVG